MSPKLPPLVGRAADSSAARPLHPPPATAPPVTSFLCDEPLPDVALPDAALPPARPPPAAAFAGWAAIDATPPPAPLSPPFAGSASNISPEPHAATFAGFAGAPRPSVDLPVALLDVVVAMSLRNAIHNNPLTRFEHSFPVGQSRRIPCVVAAHGSITSLIGVQHLVNGNTLDDGERLKVWIAGNALCTIPVVVSSSVVLPAVGSAVWFAMSADSRFARWPNCHAGFVIVCPQQATTDDIFSWNCVPPLGDVVPVAQYDVVPLAPKVARGEGDERPTAPSSEDAAVEARPVALVHRDLTACTQPGREGFNVFVQVVRPIGCYAGDWQLTYADGCRPIHALFCVKHGRAQFALTVVGAELVDRFLAIPLGSFVMLHDVSVERFVLADIPVQFSAWFQTMLLKLRGDLGSSFALLDNPSSVLVPTSPSAITYGSQMVNVHDVPLRLTRATVASLVNWRAATYSKEGNKQNIFAVELTDEVWTVVNVAEIVPMTTRSGSRSGPPATGAYRGASAASSDAAKWSALQSKLQALAADPRHDTRQTLTLFASTPTYPQGVFVHVTFWHGVLNPASLLHTRVKLKGAVWNTFVPRELYSCGVPCEFPGRCSFVQAKQFAVNGVDGWTSLHVTALPAHIAASPSAASAGGGATYAGGGATYAGGSGSAPGGSAAGGDSSAGGGAAAAAASNFGF